MKLNEVIGNIRSSQISLEDSIKMLLESKASAEEVSDHIDILNLYFSIKLKAARVINKGYAYFFKAKDIKGDERKEFLLENINGLGIDGTYKDILSLYNSNPGIFNSGRLLQIKDSTTNRGTAELYYQIEACKLTTKDKFKNIVFKENSDQTILYARFMANDMAYALAEATKTQMVPDLYSLVLYSSDIEDIGEPVDLSSNSFDIEDIGEPVDLSSNSFDTEDMGEPVDLYAEEFQAQDMAPYTEDNNIEKQKFTLVVNKDTYKNLAKQRDLKIFDKPKKNK